MSESDESFNFWISGDQVSCDWEVLTYDILHLKRNRYIDSPKFCLSGETFFLRIYAVPYNKTKNVCVHRQSIEDSSSFSCDVSMQGDDDVLTNISTVLNYSEYDEYKKVMQIPQSYFLCEGWIAIVKFKCKFHSLKKFSTKETQTTLITSEIETLSKSFENVFLEEDLSDVKINVGSQQIKAHKIILAARSPVFSSMFKHNMSEKLSGTINIEDCDSDNFESFLKFLYTGKHDLVTSSNAIKLYKIAHKYELKDLQIECIHRMLKNVTADNICDILDVCVTHEENELLETAVDFFIHNFKNILKTEKWIIFMREKSILANELLEKLADAFQN